MFHHWLLKEMSHIAIQNKDNLVLNGKKVAYIDMKFEKYPPEYSHKIKDWMWNFSAKLPDNQFLNFSNGNIDINKYAKNDLIPDNWLKYTTIVFDDDTVLN